MDAASPSSAAPLPSTTPPRAPVLARRSLWAPLLLSHADVVALDSLKVRFHDDNEDDDDVDLERTDFRRRLRAETRSPLDALRTSELGLHAPDEEHLSGFQVAGRIEVLGDGAVSRQQQQPPPPRWKTYWLARWFRHRFRSRADRALFFIFLTLNVVSLICRLLVRLRTGGGRAKVIWYLVILWLPFLTSCLKITDTGDLC